MSGDRTPERRDPPDVASTDAVHARVAVRPVRDCPVTRLAGTHGLRGLIATRTAHQAPQAVVMTDEPERLRRDGGHPVVRLGDRVVCRLPALSKRRGTEGAAACGHDSCLGHGTGFLPLEPYHTRWDGDTVHCSFAALDTDAVERVVAAFEAAGFATELEQLVPGGCGSADVPGTDRSIANLGRLTDRQREVAGAAVAAGYFDRDGPSAAQLADDLGISKATLSEHLRTVQCELVRQAFDGET
jgi:hypothetical protein